VVVVRDVYKTRKKESEKYEQVEEKEQENSQSEVGIKQLQN